MSSTGYDVPLLLSLVAGEAAVVTFQKLLFFSCRNHIHEGVVLLCLTNPFQQSKVIAVFAGLVWRSADDVLLCF